MNAAMTARLTTEPFHLDDGVHLSLAGQQAVTAALADTLTGQP
jgi:lysophospholipase L1-like esterase